MTIAALSYTTLSSALSKTGRRLLVASTTGISAGNKLIVSGEVMLVVSVVSSTELEVERGQEGTFARAKKNGVNVYYTDGANLVPGSEPDHIVLNDGNSDVYPRYRAWLGAKARDGEGNEYVMVDFQSAVGVGSWVVFNSAFLASPIASGARGRVGVVVQAATASDRWGWVQVYGYFADALLVADAASAGTSSARLAVNTSQSTPGGAAALVSDASTAAQYIHGAWPVAAVATDTTASADHTGLDIAVMLNYPYVVGYNQDFDDNT